MAQERRVVSIVSIAISVGSLAFLVLGNLTHNWWPAFTFLALALLTIALVIAWTARTRDQTFRSTVAQIHRNPRRR